MSQTEVAGSDERWAQALAMARGVVDERLVRCTRRKAVRVAVALTAVCGGVGVAGGLLALQFADDISTFTDSEITAIQIVGGILVLLGFVVVGVGTVWAHRTGRYVSRWRSVISPLNRGEQKLAYKQVAGKAAVDESRLPVLVALARQNRKVALGSLPLHVGSLLMAVGLALVVDILVFRVLEAAATLLFVVSIAVLLVAYRRSGRFLARYGSRGV